MWRDLLLVTFVGVVTCVVGLGRPAIGDSDEAFYAEAAREILETGDWLTPHYNYEARLQKPILYYWLAALTYRVGGVSAAAARWPAAVAALALVWVTYFMGRRAYDAATGRLAAVIVATSFGTFFMARQALPDLPLATCVTIATWALLLALLEPPGRVSRLPTVVPEERSPPTAVRPSETEPSPWWFVAASVATAAALLMKGPVGLVLPALVVGPLVLWERGASALRVATWRAGRLPGSAVMGAALLFLLISVPWYAAMVRVHGWQYLREFVVAEHLERFATERFNEPRPVWFYLPIIAGGLLPWSPFALLWLPSLGSWAAGSLRLAPWSRRFVVWIVAELAFFSVSVGKQPRYVLPLLVPLAILLARALATRLSPARGEPSVRNRDTLLTAPGLLCAILIGVSAVLLVRLRPLVSAVAIDPGVGGPLALTAAAMAVAGVAVWRQRWLPSVLGCAAMLCWLIVHYGALSSAGPETVERIAALVTAHRRADEPVGRFRVLVRNLVFYTRIPQVDLLTDEAVLQFLGSPRRVLCVIDETDLERLRSHARLEVTVLGAEPYLNTLNLQLRTVLWPEPARDLRRVLVVTNRSP